MRSFYLLLILAVSCASAIAQRAAGTVVRTSFNGVIETTDHYPFDICLVSGSALGKTPVLLEIEGRVLKTCSDECRSKVAADPKPFLRKLDAAVIAAQDAVYPVTERRLGRWSLCPRCNKDIDAADGPVNFVTTKNQLMKVCSVECAEQLDRDDRSAKTKLIIHSTAIQAFLLGRGELYKVNTCPVSGRELGKEPVLVQHGLTLVKLCCKDCLDEFKLTPNTFVAKLTTAAPSRADKDDAESGKGEVDAKATEGSNTSKPPVKRESR